MLCLREVLCKSKKHADCFLGKKIILCCHLTYFVYLMQMVYKIQIDTVTCNLLGDHAKLFSKENECVLIVSLVNHKTAFLQGIF